MKTVLETELRILPDSEKTNIALPFVLETDAEQMRISYTYAPKESDGTAARDRIETCLLRDAGEFRAEYPDYTHYLPLKNLITLSLDAPNGYRGCAHRQAPQQVHLLSESVCSPGFLSGKIQKGEWRLVLNVHALVTDFCDCRIRIEVGEVGDFD